MSKTRGLGWLVILFLLGFTLNGLAVVPNDPSNLEVVPRYGTNRGFVLTWQDNAGNEDGFRIERSVNGGSWTTLTGPFAPNTVQHFDAFVPAVDSDEVVYRVLAFNGDGDSGFSIQSLATTLEILWPLQDNTHDVLNGFCDYTPANIWRFHEGVDIYGNHSATQTNQRVVIASRGGRIADRTDGFSHGFMNIEVDVDGNDIYDIYLHIVFTTTKTAGDVVVAGEVLGRVNATAYGTTRDHTHSMRANSFDSDLHGLDNDGNNVLHPLLKFSNNADRDILGNSPALEDYNGDGDTILFVDKDNVSTVRVPAFGGVDILAEAFDDMTNTAPNNQNVYKVGYWIESLAPGGHNVRSAATPYVLNEFGDDWFTTSPPVENIFYHVYDSTRTGASGHSGHYILSNAGGTTGAPGDVDVDQFWNTNARAGSGSRPNGSDHGPALVNDTAKFDEGYYRLHVLLSDVVNPVVDATGDVLVDNFLPYVKRVTVHSGPSLIYEARWQLVGGTLRLDPPDPNAAIFASADPTRDINIEVEFSEPMKNTPTLAIAPLGVSPTLTSTEPVNNRKIWRATVSEVSIDDSGADNGQQNFTFSGVDLNDNPLLAVASPDPIDPATSINRDAGGNFPAVTGDDTLHRFRVGPVSGMQQILLLCVKHPGIALPADTPATLAGTIQTALNNYYSECSWSLVTFTVTAAPNWIDIDHDPAHYFAVDMEPLMELAQEAINKAVAQGVSFTGVDRVLVLTNENIDRGDHATTGFWPYNVSGSGSTMISSSVHTLATINAHYTHAAGHHLGLVDLYPYPHVTTPRPFVGQWGHMGDRGNQPHFLSWSKHRLGWITGSGNTEATVARPAVGSPIVGSDFTITPLETDTDDTKAVIIEVADRLSYYVENRRQSGLDSGLDEAGVIITKVNELVEPGAGPAVVVDPTSDNDLTDACFTSGQTFTDANVRLSIQVLAPTGTSENIRINYDPPSDRNDVTITRQNGNWHTPDIWVDAPDEAGAYATDPEAVDDAPRVGEANRLYCRVWNNGDAPATDFRVIMEIREPWSTGTDFHKIDEFFVPVLAGSGAHAIFWTEWSAAAGVHTCVRVRILDVSNDDNPANNETQENIHTFETPGSSPYQPVISNFDIGNPYDEEVLVYMRVDGLPDGWTIELNPEKTRLDPGANTAANVKIIPLEDAPRCSTENITITAYAPRGDTMVPLGAITLRVHLVNGQSITHDTEVRCRQEDDPKYTAMRSMEGWNPRQDCTAITRGCTDPPRPNETVLIVYEAPDGTKIVRQVTTDEYGCFEDYFNLGEAGIWEVTTVLEGDDCNQRAESDPTEAEVPGGDMPFGKRGQFLLSFHYGGSFPLGSFARIFDNGFSLNLDFEWRFHARAGIVFYYGHHQFYSNELPNEFIRQFSLNGKYYIPWRSWQLFLQGGPGRYDPEFSSAEWGYNLGCGIQLPISQRLALEISANYHRMLTERKYDWLSAQMGIAFEFLRIE